MAQQRSMDLSRASNVVMGLILQRIPANDLLDTCVLVSRQWRRILEDKYFWISKYEYEGHPPLDWHNFAGLSFKAYRNIAIRRPFRRNFVRDAWDLDKQSMDAFKPDERFDFHSGAYSVEIPPLLADGPKPDPDKGEEVQACIATGHATFYKMIVIKLADEGLTNELLDVFRPTIIVSELVTSRRDCASFYRMHSRLLTSDQSEPHQIDPDTTNDNDLTLKRKRQCLTKMMIRDWEEERWHKVEHVFDEYPIGIGMRYLALNIFTCGSGEWPQVANGNSKATKMAKISVRVLNKSNARVNE